MNGFHAVPLAPYAIGPGQSRGRAVEEAPPSWRSEFQRDRDRIIHSSAFRRLEYKTQVFVNHEGDMFRTRLTHSLEVAQIARAIARALGVNEDLTEAIALAHDLGHTPFGHAGQTALNACMSEFGGFEHNLQSLRVVDVLEQRYPRFDGLNLLFETREGILKHCSRRHAAALGALGERFLRGEQPSVEAQIANVADEIAYNHHDIDDGLRSGILTLETVSTHAVFRQALESARGRYHDLDDKRLLYTAIRMMLGNFTDDLIHTSRQRLDDLAGVDAQTVRERTRPVIDFSPAVREQHLSLKRLLHKELYSAPQVRYFTDAAKDIVSALFAVYSSDSALLPPDQRLRSTPAAADPARVVADYIAGMTDRFAIAEYRKHVGQTDGVIPFAT